MEHRELLASLRELALKFPEDLVAAQLEDLPRVAFHLELIVDRMGSDVRVCDIGSGLGLFPSACASLGMQATMMDDFAPPFEDPETARTVPDAPDAVNYDRVDEALALHRSLGVRVERRDPLVEGFGFPSGSLDVVTCFDSMEHWHRSPKKLFGEVREALVPGGIVEQGQVGAPGV